MGREPRALPLYRGHSDGANWVTGLTESIGKLWRRKGCSANGEFEDINVAEHSFFYRLHVSVRSLVDAYLQHSTGRYTRSIPLQLTFLVSTRDTGGVSLMRWSFGSNNHRIQTASIVAAEKIILWTTRLNGRLRRSWNHRLHQLDRS